MITFVGFGCPSFYYTCVYVYIHIYVLGHSDFMVYRPINIKHGNWCSYSVGNGPFWSTNTYFPYIAAKAAVQSVIYSLS